MKTKLFFVLCMMHGICYAQNVLYRQSHKILEYNYAVVDTADMKRLSELEKIKHELKFVSKTFSKTIYANYESVLELRIDTNEYHEAWMHLPGTYKYTAKGIEVYDQNLMPIEIMPYTEREQQDRDAEQAGMDTNGYHPGLLSFPDFSDAAIPEFAKQGIVLQNLGNEGWKMVFPEKVVYLNRLKQTIVTEYTDKEGKRNRETRGYEPYGNQMGYLLKVKKHERFLHSVNGPCITETRLSLYTDYMISDEGKLMEKALRKQERLILYPNPNDGVFTVKAELYGNNGINSAKIINVLNGNALAVDVGTQKTFLVNLPNLPSGQYVLQVITTDQKALSVSFFKN